VASIAISFLRDRLGDTRVAIADPECVDTAALYEFFLRDLWSTVSEGTLHLNHFTSVEGTPRTLTVTMNGSAPLSFEVEGDTDWADLPAVVRATNELLVGIGDTRHFVEFRDKDFGQESGFVLLTRDELLDLLEFGLKEDTSLSLTYGAGEQIEPVSEDFGGDGGDAWERLWFDLSA
jgi:hypothetical protein